MILPAGLTFHHVETIAVKKERWGKNIIVRIDNFCTTIATTTRREKVKNDVENVLTNLFT